VKTNKNQHVWERFVTIVIPGGDKSVLSAVAAYSENSGVLVLEQTIAHSYKTK
jgi:hypothetical protein